jgi:hypothetical protein
MLKLAKKVNEKSLELSNIDRDLKEIIEFLTGDKEPERPNILTGDISSLPLSFGAKENTSIIDYLNNTQARLDNNIGAIKSKLEEIKVIIGLNAL